MNKYTAMYRGKRIDDLEALTTYEAQEKAAVVFKAKKSYDVIVVLTELGDRPEEPVVHLPLM